jgi:hypothetical protein
MSLIIDSPHITAKQARLSQENPFDMLVAPANWKRV